MHAEHKIYEYYTRICTYYILTYNHYTPRRLSLTAHPHHQGYQTNFCDKYVLILTNTHYTPYPYLNPQSLTPTPGLPN